MKSIYKWSRWLHIYVSSGLFSLLIFFCLTGVLLNHLDWVSGDKDDASQTGQIPQDTFEQFKQVNEANGLALISAYVSREYGLPSPYRVEWDSEFNELILDYPLPAGYAAMTLNTLNGQYTLDYQIGTVVQVMNDLHKGRHSGSHWRWLIDTSALLIVFFATTGIVLLLQNRRKRYIGIGIVLAGTLTPYLLYYFFVPRLFTQ